ncbi:hypothetical protein AB0D04_08690 [Streptomyces sp. NPDC048483]|uniref:hypothetical protein n=1 Tax=Streptomyces sp. NPDC048483 TaxID=3154927 RepID=UPI003443133D
MKQGTIKTLGAAALGAAFAVAAAGTAAAAPVDAADANGLLSKLPVKAATDAASGAAKAAKSANGGVQTSTNDKGNTLGGMPINPVKGVAGVTKGLPVHVG